jgi:methyl-accepting chemotaxis protein
MKNLKVWQKLALLGVLFLIPFAVVTFTLIYLINKEHVEFTQLEIDGTGYYPPLSALLQDLQQHSAMDSALLNGDASFQDGVTAKGKDIEADLAKVDLVDQQFGAALSTTKTWTDLRAAISDLLNKAPGFSAGDSLDQHQKVINATIVLITNVSDNSKITLDPVYDTYYAGTVVLYDGPSLTDCLAQAREIGCAMAARKNGTPDEFDNLNTQAILADSAQNSTGQVADLMNKMFAFNPAHKTELGADTQAGADAVKAALDTIKHLVATRKPPTAAGTFNSDMTSHIDQIYKLENHANDTLNGLLQVRVAHYQNIIYQTLAWAAFGWLLVCIVGFFIMRDITAPLNQVVEIADQIAKGDLSVQPVSKGRRDEIGTLAQAFDRMLTTFKGMVGVAERIAAGDLAVRVKPQSDHDAMGNAFSTMIEKLSQLISQVQKAGIQVNTSATEIAATSKQQQATASEIAATTTEISATSKQISATSKELVRTMNQVSAGAEQSATLAGSGQASLSHMEETMQQVMEAARSIGSRLAVLNEKAGNINQVVTTISKVADQTNLLSLNAAIEAEKAGEYGRGFAVVATEIRRLADQTAVATFDIEQMVREIQSAVSAGVMGVDKFSEEVRRGMQDVHQVGAQLSQIIQEVQALAPRFEAVNEGMQAQATGAEQITEALSQLSEAAQQTVESLRQSNQVIDGLNQASLGLRSSVSRFKLEDKI